MLFVNLNMFDMINDFFMDCRQNPKGKNTYFQHDPKMLEDKTQDTQHKTKQ